MATLESLFIKEFKKRTSVIKSKNIYDIPLPAESSSWNIDPCKRFAINGLSEEVHGLYANLNKTFVLRPTGYKAIRRKVNLVTKKFEVTSSGEYITEEIPVPAGSALVLSKVQLNIPYNYTCPSKECGYIDFRITKDGSREYLYYLPKSCLYEVGQTALALSVKNMKNYSGMGYKTWNFGKIFLHVIPYNPNSKYVGSKILKTKVGLNYSEEIQTIVDFWMSEGVIPDLSLCNISDGYNIALSETAVGYDDYIQISQLSLGEKEQFAVSNESQVQNEENY